MVPLVFPALTRCPPIFQAHSLPLLVHMPARVASLSSPIQERVKIVEVGPRDGLQNESTLLPTEKKVEFIHRLVQAGCSWIEVGSFVSPTRVPQMTDTLEVLKHIQGAHFSALVPNRKGMLQAMETKVNEIAIFAAASETFSQKNIGCSIQESFGRFQEVMKLAKQANLPVRGYVSCIVGCPYEGSIEPTKVAEVAEKLYAMGCYEISLGDTIGISTPASIQKLLPYVSRTIPISKLALHCHDTYGQALANILVGLQFGVRTFDCSVAGLGGCPYAPGASGNVATEDVVYMLHGMGYDTGIFLGPLAKSGQWISQQLQKPYTSKSGYAYLKKWKAKEAMDGKAKL